MTENTGNVHELCMDITARMMVALIESGKLPANDAESVGRYYAELYRIVYAVRLGKYPSSPK